MRRAWPFRLGVAALLLQAVAAAGAEEVAAPAAPDPLHQPALATEEAPERFRVELATTRGNVVLEVHRDWAPHGADRFFNLVKMGYYQDVAFFRVIPNFMAQFGIHGDPEVARVWRQATIPDDPVVQSNQRGYVSFAKTNRPNSRTTQLFINFRANQSLDAMGFAPFARVVEGMDVVDAIYKIGEGRPRGPGPAQQRIHNQGNAYLKEKFPKLDYIQSARVME